MKTPCTSEMLPDRLERAKVGEAMSDLVFTAMNIEDVDFSTICLNHCTFYKCNIINCSFTDTDMSYCEFIQSNVDSCDFSDANMSYTENKNSNFNDCIAVDAEFTGSTINTDLLITDLMS